MAEIREGTLAEVARRRLQLSGQDLGINELVPELVPTMVLEHDRPEWAYYKGEKLGVGLAAVGAVAAQFGYAQIFNPSSNSQPLLVVVESISAQMVSLTDIMALYRYDAQIGVVQAAYIRDYRFADPFPSGVEISPTAQISVVNTATNYSSGAHAVMDCIGGAPHTTSTFWTWRTPYILPPQCGLLVRPVSQNILHRTTFRWRERRMASSEF